MNTYIVLVICLFVTAVSCSPAGYYPAPVAAPISQPYEDRDYRFAYAVKDDASYNQQTREESKYGNTVSGQYTVLEPTGELRVVNYIADENGFRAEVQNQPQAGGYNNYAAPAPVKLRAPYARAFPHH